MPINIDFLSTYTLMAINEEVVPPRNFFHDRYFPTEAGDIFASDKVLTEYRKGDRKLAAFVAQRAGDIPMDRRGYAIHEYEPAYIAPSRLLTIDELNKRGFGEALYANSTPAQRAARLLLDDMNDMELRISRRLEWMCAQVMQNNACTMQTYIDATTQGEAEYVQFYDSSSDHTYAISTNYWILCYLANNVPMIPRPKDAPTFPPSFLPNFPNWEPKLLPISRPMVPVAAEAVPFIACLTARSFLSFCFCCSLSSFS